MADYIDRAKLIEDGIAKGFCNWYDEIKFADTADVVERSKVEKLIEEINTIGSNGWLDISTEEMIDIIHKYTDKEG